MPQLLYHLLQQRKVGIRRSVAVLHLAQQLRESGYQKIVELRCGSALLHFDFCQALLVSPLVLVSPTLMTLDFATRACALASLASADIHLMKVAHLPMAVWLLPSAGIKVLT